MRITDRIVLSLLALCLAVIVGLSFAHADRGSKHYFRFLHAARGEEYAEAIREYHHIPPAKRNDARVAKYYEEAKGKVGDSEKFDLMPTVERADLGAFGIFLLGCVACYFVSRPRKRKLYSANKISAPEPPTEGQLQFIRRINNGFVPYGLTKDSAAVFIKSKLSQISSAARRQRIDVNPFEFMSASRARREQLRIERERKRAQEKLVRQKEMERKRAEREANKAQRAEERLYNKRLAEEEKLLEVRDDSREGVVRKAKTDKARTILELQNLVNDILADKVIEPQEVRQLKAWLLENQRTADEFAPMLKVIDDSLQDGIIDAEETQSLYEGVIDCLVTLRSRTSN